MNTVPEYNSLDDIARGKAVMVEKRRQKAERIRELWAQNIAIDTKGSRADMVTSIINKSVVAFDAFMLMRKLTRHYKSFTAIFRRKKKK